MLGNTKQDIKYTETDKIKSIPSCEVGSSSVHTGFFLLAAIQSPPSAPPIERFV